MIIWRKWSSSETVARANVVASTIIVGHSARATIFLYTRQTFERGEEHAPASRPVRHDACGGLASLRFRRRRVFYCKCSANNNFLEDLTPDRRRR